jgi:hypothetical protein
MREFPDTGDPAHISESFVTIFWFKITSADPGCLSRIPDPDFYPSRIRISDPGSRISDPKIATKEGGEKKISCHTFFET